MKGKITILVILFMIIAVPLGITTFKSFEPQKLISGNDTAKIFSVTYQGKERTFDEQDMMKILMKYDSKRTLKKYFPYQSKQIEMEIEALDNGNPKHILLGEFNIWYISADQGAFEILDSQKLKNELYDYFKTDKS